MSTPIFSTAVYRSGSQRDALDACDRLEIRQVVADMKHDQATKKLTFLEWACAVFKKSWEELHSEVEVRRTPSVPLLSFILSEEKRLATACGLCLMFTACG